MKLTPILKFGEEFGKIDNKVRGIVTYRLSPHELRAFAGAISHGLPNSARRLANAFIITAPFFATSYFIYSEANKDYERRCRKNPDDYKNDK